MRHPAVLAPAIGVAGFAGLAMAGAQDPHRVLAAYLIAFAFAVSIPLGVMAWSMVCDACGAVWFVPLRRSAEAVTATFPLLAILFLPIVAGLPWLYPWAGGHVPPPSGDVVPGWRSYLTPSGFALRAGICFAGWIAIAECQRHWSLRQERAGSPDLSRRRRALSAAGLLPLALTVTMAVVDWYLSLEPSWRSTMAGFIHLAGAATAGVAMLIILVAWASRAGRLPSAVGAEHAHALGNALLTSVLLWSYLSFMQFLVVWMGDLPDEAAWYVVRIGPGWRWLALGLVVFHGIGPWLILLFRGVKRDLRALTWVAVGLLVMHAGDLYWQLAPAALPDGAWTARQLICDAAALAGILGCCAAFACWRQTGVAPIPRNDPDLAAGLAYQGRA